MSAVSMAFVDAEQAAVPQGWYTDPLEPESVRWWTGQDWTHYVQPRPERA